MKLYAEYLFAEVLKSRNRAKRRRGDRAETRGQLGNHIGMAHKDGLLGRQLSEKIG